MREEFRDDEILRVYLIGKFDSENGKNAKICFRQKILYLSICKRRFVLMEQIYNAAYTYMYIHDDLNSLCALKFDVEI